MKKYVQIRKELLIFISLALFIFFNINVNAEEMKNERLSVAVQTDNVKSNINEASSNEFKTAENPPKDLGSDLNKVEKKGKEKEVMTG